MKLGRKGVERVRYADGKAKITPYYALEILEGYRRNFILGFMRMEMPTQGGEESNWRNELVVKELEQIIEVLEPVVERYLDEDRQGTPSSEPLR